MNFNKKIPEIYLEMDENDMEHGLGAISFVDRPAIKKTWTTFNNEYRFKLEEEERIIHTPIMLSETPIYRVSELYGEYFVKFSKDTIKKMMIKYFKDNKIHQVNENHDSKRPVKGVYMVESYIIGERSKSNVYDDLPEGTWVASFFVEDKDYWNNVVKSDQFTGVSLEGYFDEKWEELFIEQIFKEVEKIAFSKDLNEDDKLNKIKNILNK